MPRHQETRLVPHSAADMFALVADVASYPAFVPHCHAMVVRPGAAELGGEVLIARMTVAFGPLRESYTSRVALDRPALAIHAKAIDGPFTKLESRWRFEPVDPASCRVGFVVDYQFRSAALGFLFSGLFDRQFRRIVRAFEARADKVFGTGRKLAGSNQT